MFSRLREIIKYTIQCACITHCAFEYIGDFVVCNGPSMEPTLYTNNVLITERLSRRVQKFERGDIVVAVSPIDPKQYVCKRIVGIPGDTITSQSMPIISPDLLDELDAEDKQRALNASFRHYTNHTVVPRGHVWLEGDNKSNSSDSRYYGPIPLGLIKSRIVCRVWPISDMRML